MFKRLFVSLLLLMFVISCGGGSDSDTTMEQVQEALEEMEEEMEDPEEEEEQEMEEEEMEDTEEEMEEPEMEEPEEESFCEQNRVNHPSSSPQFAFHISENLNTEERESFKICFEAGTPGSPVADEPGILWNQICEPSCAPFCPDEWSLLEIADHVKGQSQLTEEDEEENRYRRCRAQLSPGVWQPWTDWTLYEN